MRQRLLWIFMMLGITLALRATPGLGDTFPVISPAADETWLVGETHTIAWLTDVPLDVFRNDGTIVLLGPINGNMPGITEIAAWPLDTITECGFHRLCWNWHIRNSQVSTEGTYRIMVSVFYAGDYHDYLSPFFTIRKPHLKPGALAGLPHFTPPDLAISDFKGEILQPGQPDHAGHTDNNKRVQLKWTVKNLGQGKTPSQATTLFVKGAAEGNAPLPDDWKPEMGPCSAPWHRVFPVGALDPGSSQDVYEVFAVPDGSVRFRFDAWVNPVQGETTLANNNLTSIYAPPETIPDLALTGFEGKLLQPGQPDHAGQVSNDRRVQLKWTVKNVGPGRAPYQATLLRVRGVADGNAPLQVDWKPDVNMKRKDFPIAGLEAGASHDVYEVFAVPDGSVKFRFNAQVNPDHAGGELNYTNNGRMDTFALKLTGHPPARLKPIIHFISPLNGGTIHIGGLLLIRWQNIGLKEQRVRLVLKRMQLRVRDITPAGGVINEGVYRWKIPGGIRPGAYAIVMEAANGRILGSMSIRIQGILPATAKLSHKNTLKEGKKPPVVLKKLWLQSPRGMETWYIGKTYPVT